MKWKLLIIMVLLLPLVAGGVEVQYSLDNLTWENITNVNEPDDDGYQVNLQPGTLYYFRGRNETSEWNYTSQRTKVAGEIIMAGLAITVFVLLIAGALFWLSAKKELLKNKYTDFIARRCCLLLGIFLMILNSAIMASISENAGLGLNQEMFFFMELFGYIGYPAMIILTFATLVQTLKEWKIDKQNKRTGGDYGE